MKLSYGAGIVVVVLAPFVLFFIKALDVNNTLFLVFLLFGAWTIVESFAEEDRLDRTRYLVSGIVLALASTAFIILVTYAVALTLIGVIIAVVIASTRKKS